MLFQMKFLFFSIYNETIPSILLWRAFVSIKWNKIKTTVCSVVHLLMIELVNLATSLPLYYFSLCEKYNKASFRLVNKLTQSAFVLFFFVWKIQQSSTKLRFVLLPFASGAVSTKLKYKPIKKTMFFDKFAFVGQNFVLSYCRLVDKLTLCVNLSTSTCTNLLTTG
jgi:hypothetical protein